MKRTLTISLDFDWFYRKAGPWLAGIVEKVIVVGRREVVRAAAGAGLAVLGYFSRYYGGRSIIATAWTSRSMLVVVMALLAGFLLFYYA